MFIVPFILIAVLVAIFRVWSPWRPRVHGVPLRTLRMPFLARLYNQALPLALLMAATIANELIGSLPFWVPVVPLVGLVLSVTVRAQYTITTAGVSVGALTFRRWTEFSGLTVRRGRIRLKSISGVRPLEIWLPGRFHDADTIAEIRRLIRGAYQGRGATVDSAEDATVSSDAGSPMAVI